MTMIYQNLKMLDAKLKELESEFEPLLDFVKVLAERIETEVQKVSGGDPTERLRLEYGLYHDSDSIPEEIKTIFKEKPPTHGERALSGAWNYVDEALVYLDVDGNPTEGALSSNYANQFFGVYLGLSDPRVLNRHLANLAKQRHAKTNYLRKKIEADYLKNIGRFGSKSEAAKFYSEKHPGKISVDRIKKWLGQLPLPTNPKRKKYR